MPEIQFPTSTQPGIHPTESGGRLINVFADKAPDGSRSKVVYRPAPGLRPAFTVGSDDFRGALNVNETLYVVNGAAAYSVTKSGSVYTVTALTGTVGGTGPAMMERNMRTTSGSSTPDVLILHSDGQSLINVTAGTVGDYTDADLPVSNSLSFLDSYFLWTIATGLVFASGQNATTVNALDTATAEASPDGLVRGITVGQNHLLMGQNSIEFWADAGNPTGYPFSRSTVIPIGLFSSRAVAGMERGFPGDVCFVSNDRRARRLNGYSAPVISNSYIDHLLAGVDADELDASVYSVAGHACWVLTADDWTLVFDQSTGEWHERASLGASRWRAQGGVNVFDNWIAFERGGNQAYVIDPDYRRENDDQLVCELRSVQDHRFPGRFVVKQASFDIMTGVGSDRGISPIETNPVVEISWSDDGGITFCPPTQRSLGTQGEVTRIDRRNCGMTRQLGRQWRLVVADPVAVSIMGAAMDIEERAA